MTLLGLMDVQLPRPFLPEGSTLPLMTMELSGSGLMPWALSGSGDPTAARVCVDIHGSGYHHQRQYRSLGSEQTLEAIFVSKVHAAIGAMQIRVVCSAA